MPMLPWGRKYEAVKKAEELLKECCDALSLDKKVLGQTGREWVARRRWDDGHSEMRRLVYYAALTSKGAEVEAGHFPPRCSKDHEAYAKAEFESLSLEDAVRVKMSHFFEKLGKFEVRDVHHTVIAQVEKPLVELCLKWADGNQVKASRVLGLNRNTLRKKIKELGIK